MIGRHRKDPKGLPTETLFMLSGSIRGQIGTHLSLKTALRNLGAADRHGAAIDLDHKATP
jgi:hypothetical protein